MINKERLIQDVHILKTHIINKEYGPAKFVALDIAIYIKNNQ